MEKDVAADGIVKCVANACRLIESAQSLFSQNYDVGTALLVTAVEEYSKAIMITYVYEGLISEKEFTKFFKNHDMKRGLAKYLTIVGSAVVEDPKEAFRFTQILGNLDFNAARDDVLYVNFRSGGFVAPEYDEDNFPKILRLALRLKRYFNTLAMKENALKLLDSSMDESKTSEEIRRAKIAEKLLDVATKSVSDNNKRGRSD